MPVNLSIPPGLLQGIRAELLSDEAVQAAINAAHHVLAAQKPADNGKQIGKLKAKVDNLADAIAGGALKSSPALASRLAKAEKELATLEAAEPAPKAAQMIPKLVDEYRAWVNELETILSPDGLKRGLVSDRDIARARAQLRKRLGAPRLEPASSQVQIGRAMQIKRPPPFWRAAFIIW